MGRRLTQMRKLNRQSLASVCVGAACVAIVLLCPVGGCERTDTPAESAKPIFLVASGDTAGWIMPCGCTANQSGGLLRRGTYLAGLREKGETLYLDAGGAAGGASEYHKVKFEAILRGERQMGVVAHNLGKSEVTLGGEFLRDVAKRTNVTFLSANATDDAGQPLADSHVTVEKGGRRFAIVGVLSPKFATAQVKVTDPRQAVLNAIAPRPVGPTLLAAATNKGKFLVQLERSAGATAWAGRVVEMGQSLADSPEQAVNLKAYLAELEQRNFTAAQSGLAASLPLNLPAGYRIAGSAACLSCHKDDHTSWAQSKHSHAWQTLEQKGMHVDNYCMQCHTTGFGLPGGFESRTASIDLVNVGCESCHGPSQAHADKPKIRTAFAAADQCVRCHDHENSPAFVYGTYWPRIRHGETKTASSTWPSQLKLPAATTPSTAVTTAEHAR